MTNRAVTAMSVHATLEDLGYQTCWKHGTEPYRWMGPRECPRCEALNNPNLIPRSFSPPPSQAAPPSGSKDSRSGRNEGQIREQQYQLKLTEEQVIELRDRYWLKGETLVALGEKYGVHNTTISKAVNKQAGYASIEYMPDTSNRPTIKNNAHVPNLTPEQVREIRKRSKDGETRAVLGEAYNRDPHTISDICRRRTWKHI